MDITFNREKKDGIEAYKEYCESWGREADLDKAEVVDLNLSDTPHTIHIENIKGGVKTAKLINLYGRWYMLVEKDTKEITEYLKIDITPTGGLFTEDQIKHYYHGTILWGFFVWHIFAYSYPEDTEAAAPYPYLHRPEQPNSDDEIKTDLWTIYKYPFDINGETRIEINSNEIKPLFAGFQFGSPMIWVAVSLKAPRPSMTLDVLCSNDQEEDGYEFLTDITLKNDSEKSVFYKHRG